MKAEQLRPLASVAPTALVADIGGTNARFALAAQDAQGRPQLQALREFPAAGFASLAQAVEHYLAETAAPRPQRAVIAVASAVTGDRIKVTNSPWAFSIAALARELAFQRIEVINDYAAIGTALPQLDDAQLLALGEALPAMPRVRSHRQLAVLGPGTGLGVCSLLLRGGEAIVLESEGGHIGFAPCDDYEIAILQRLRLRHARLSVERLISGPGLCNLHAALCEVDGLPTVPLAPEEITADAMLRAGGACYRAVQLFCAILGSFAGDVALMLGAWDGVYLAGGMTTRLLPWIQRSDFRRRFEDKGRFRGLLQTVPAYAITHPQPGLLGAGAWAFRSPLPAAEREPGGARSSRRSSLPPAPLPEGQGS